MIINIFIRVRMPKCKTYLNKEQGYLFKTNKYTRVTNMMINVLTPFRE